VDEDEVNDVKNIDILKSHNSDDDAPNLDDEDDIKKSSTSNLSDSGNINLFSHNSEEHSIAQKRLWLCVYIFNKIDHQESDSCILHAANIMINTINKSDCNFS